MDVGSDYIKLDSFLKLVNAVSSGGEAKIVIGNGKVKVNRMIETRRGRKLRPGDIVEFSGYTFDVERELAGGEP